MLYGFHTIVFYALCTHLCVRGQPSGTHAFYAHAFCTVLYLGPSCICALLSIYNLLAGTLKSQLPWCVNNASLALLIVAMRSLCRWVQHIISKFSIGGFLV